MTTGTRSATMTVWRDHDQEVLRLPSMAGQTRSVPDRSEDPDSPARLAAGLYRGGARRVALHDPVDLSGRTAADALVGTMMFLAELTSWGIVVDWEVELGAEPEIWRSFSHLHPPRAVLEVADADAVLQPWSSTFYLCKCVYRQGPGFVQVRDRRMDGALSRFTIHDPAYLSAVRKLAAGCRFDEVPAEVLGELVGESLAGRAGELAWWLPYRVRRWPWPSFAV